MDSKRRLTLKLIFKESLLLAFAVALFLALGLLTMHHIADNWEPDPIGLEVEGKLRCLETK